MLFSSYLDQTSDAELFSGIWKNSNYGDNTSVTNLSKNPTQHSGSMHIGIKHHFLIDDIQRGDIELKFVEIKFQLVDFLTKRLTKEKFNFIKSLINIKNINNFCNMQIYAW